MTTDPDREELPLPRSLSPSRMSDFKKCPKSFYFKSILRLPTDPTMPQLVGTFTHAVLEHLFLLPRPERTLATALELRAKVWEELKLDGDNDFVVATDEARAAYSAAKNDPTNDPAPEADTSGSADGDEESEPRPRLEEDPEKVTHLFDTVELMLTNYFTIEDPTRFDPTGLEQWVRAEIAGFNFGGIIDRLDVIPSAGDEVVIISDYKTGKLPSERFEEEAFFGMKIYALLYAESTGTTPSSLRLVYLKEPGTASVKRRAVTPQQLRATRDQIVSIARGIRKAHATNNWPTKTSKLCDWCDFQAQCPAFATELKGIAS